MSQVSYAIQDLNSTINQFESNVDVHVNNIIARFSVAKTSSVCYKA